MVLLIVQSQKDIKNMLKKAKIYQMNLQKGVGWWSTLIWSIAHSGRNNFQEPETLELTFET